MHARPDIDRSSPSPSPGLKAGSTGACRALQLPRRFPASTVRWTVRSGAKTGSCIACAPDDAAETQRLPGCLWTVGSMPSMTRPPIMPTTQFPFPLHPSSPARTDTLHQLSTYNIADYRRILLQLTPNDIGNYPGILLHLIWRQTTSTTCLSRTERPLSSRPFPSGRRSWIYPRSLPVLTTLITRNSCNRRPIPPLFTTSRTRSVETSHARLRSRP